MKLRTRLFIVLLVVMMMLSVVTPALAEGDKVRGDNGDGGVYMYMYMWNCAGPHLYLDGYAVPSAVTFWPIPY